MKNFLKRCANKFAEKCFHLDAVQRFIHHQERLVQQIEHLATSKEQYSIGGIAGIIGEQYGYCRTLRSKKPENAAGEPLPWYTYPAIEYFKQWDVFGWDVFEYGSGQSSLFWASRGANVHSVEHNPEWYNTINLQSSSLKSYSLCEDKETYVAQSGISNIVYDMIIIDGRWRTDCALEALKNIKPSGFIILDNSDWYSDVATMLRNRGYFEIDWNGFGPINGYTWTTSLFLPFVSPLMKTMQHPNPVGGIKVMRDARYW